MQIFDDIRTLLANNQHEFANMQMIPTHPRKALHKTIQRLQARAHEILRSRGFTYTLTKASSYSIRKTYPTQGAYLERIVLDACILQLRKLGMITKDAETFCLSGIAPD